MVMDCAGLWQSGCLPLHGEAQTNPGLHSHGDGSLQATESGASYSICGTWCVGVGVGGPDRAACLAMLIHDGTPQ